MGSLKRAGWPTAPPRTGEKIGGEEERKAALNIVVKESKIDRYQLVIGSLEVPCRSVNVNESMVLRVLYSWVRVIVRVL